MNEKITEFEELFIAMMGGTPSRSDLHHLIALSGVDTQVAHMLVDAAQKVKKLQIMEEVKKQSESLVYWVDQR